MSMVKTDKLVFEYEKRDEEGNVIGTQRAIDEVDIQIEKGRFIAILGHNGSGKSDIRPYPATTFLPYLKTSSEFESIFTVKFRSRLNCIILAFSFYFLYYYVTILYFSAVLR